MLLKQGKALEQDPLGWRCNLVADGRLGAYVNCNWLKERSAYLIGQDANFVGP